MGLARATVHLLLTEAVRRPSAVAVETLGRQHVYVTASEVAHMADSTKQAALPFLGKF
jgi:hypothetical protein